MAYDPIVIDVTMSQYGYWVVTVSVSPGLRMRIMASRVGITQQEAADDAIIVVAAMSTPRSSV